MIIFIMMCITLGVALSNRSRLKDMEVDMAAIKKKLNIADKDTPITDEEIEAELQKMHEEDQK